MTILQFLKQAFFLILACFNIILSTYMSHFAYGSFVVLFAIFSPVMFLPGFITHKANKIYCAMLVSVVGIFQAFEIAWKYGGEIVISMQMIAGFYVIAITALWIITEITLLVIALKNDD